MRSRRYNLSSRKPQHIMIPHNPCEYRKHLQTHMIFHHTVILNNNICNNNESKHKPNKLSAREIQYKAISCFNNAYMYSIRIM